MRIYRGFSQLGMFDDQRVLGFFPHVKSFWEDLRLGRGALGPAIGALELLQGC